MIYHMFQLVQFAVDNGIPPLPFDSRVSVSGWKCALLTCLVLGCCISRSMPLDEQCKAFFDGTNKLNRLCAAYYPSFGTSPATGDEYVVYQLDGKESRYFITLGMSAITSCKGTMYMESESEYQCEGVTLQLPPTKLPKLYCLTFPFVFSRILIGHCTRNDSINPEQTAILYPNTRKFQSFATEM
ncbi:hypothetical protein GQX74_013472 [Glossina fuscipes]|nr:hypothetical protein GQX74_013472 [Glossina fuscipes]